MKVLASVAMLLLVSAAGYAADVDGKWTGTFTSPTGDLPVTFNFKADGAKLTGTTLGLDGMEVQIKDGKIADKTISFTVEFDFGGMPLALSYKGVVEADQIKMTAEVFGMPFEFVVKKAKE